MFDSLPSQLSTMTFINIEIKRENSIKFLGVIINENFESSLNLSYLDSILLKYLTQNFSSLVR